MLRARQVHNAVSKNEQTGQLPHAKAWWDKTSKAVKVTPHSPAARRVAGRGRVPARACLL